MAVVVSSPVNDAMYEPAPSSCYPPKSFHVKNIDDEGRIIHIGYLEVTDSEIVFKYEHHPKFSSHWPLSCIRKYGVNLDGDIFAFEAGRRAPEGEGSFAFRTEGVQACEIRQRVDYYTHYRTACF